MEYAKLIRGEAEIAPRVLRDGAYTTYNPPAELLKAHGYKPIQYTAPPETAPGCIAVPGWRDTGEIILQTWTQEPEDDISDVEVLNILLGGAAT